MKQFAVRISCAVVAGVSAMSGMAQAGATAGMQDAPGAQRVTFPVKPVRVMVPQTAGSSADFFARLLGELLSERWSVPVVVDNRAGAGGSIAMEAVAKANPDGYTIAVTTEGA